MCDAALKKGGGAGTVCPLLRFSQESKADVEQNRRLVPSMSSVAFSQESKADVEQNRRFGSCVTAIPNQSGTSTTVRG